MPLTESWRRLRKVYHRLMLALQITINKINAMPVTPSFVLHTDELLHLTQADQFDTQEQPLKSVKTKKIFYVPC